VTDREPVPGIVYEQQLHRRFLPEITLAEVNELAKNWVPDRSRVITVSAPEKEGLTVPDEQKLSAVVALARKDLTAYVDTVDAAPLLDPLPAPGAIVKTGVKESYGITELQLKNGIKVVLKPTDFREDEILFRATSFGGLSQVSDADYLWASGASNAVNVGGLGRLSTIDLRKKMTGKTASANASISEYEEGLNGSSSKKDLETMFQLIHLRFTQPRRDPQAFGAMQTQMRSFVANQRSSPDFLFSEALTGALRQGHMRARPLSTERIDALDLDKSMAFYKDRFGDAGDFTFVFVGSFDVATMTPLIERYLGSLPSQGRKESWKDTGIRYAKGLVEKRVEKGVEPQSRATIVFTGPFKHDQTQRVAIRAMADVLSARLRETLRENLGGTYTVSASAGYAQIPVPEYSVTIGFSSAPERNDELVKATLEQVELLKTQGPTEKQVTDAKERLLRDLETSRKQNAYFVTQLSLRYQYGEEIDSLFTLEEFYKKLTAKAIQDAAKLYLNPANMVKVTLFPEKKTVP
jgi:zinc protease